jgi:DNA-binding NarL/FixJ family response regulator
MISVAIVEDNDSVRQTLSEWIDSSPDCRCVCACTTGKEALVEIPRHRPNVVLIDIDPPGESGITCTRRLKQRSPGCNYSHSLQRSRDDLWSRAGACGYLLKCSSREEILRAIVDVRSGGAPMTGEIARRVVEVFQRPPSPPADGVNVSRRENEVLQLLSKGMSNKQIAASLGISYETVCVHLRRIYKTSVTEAV